MVHSPLLSMEHDGSTCTAHPTHGLWLQLHVAVAMHVCSQQAIAEYDHAGELPYQYIQRILLDRCSLHATIMSSPCTVVNFRGILHSENRV